MADRVREPIQTYLTSEERAELDRVAAALGVSRSEALRRGVRSLARRLSHGSLAELVEAGLVRPPTASGRPPPRPDPVAGLAELLSELDDERTDR